MPLRTENAMSYNAHDMVQTCFRHQHPELYGRRSVEESIVPFRYREQTGRTPTYPASGVEPSDRGLTFDPPHVTPSATHASLPADEE